MANLQHLGHLKQGISAWNTWRKNCPTIQPDLSYVNLSSTNLSGINFSNVNLQVANLFGADLSGANLSEANLRLSNLVNADLSKANLLNASLFSANLFGVNLSEANLRGANLQAVNLSGADLQKADLSEANLNGTMLVKANLTEAILTNCFIYGVAAWNVELKEAKQNNLIVTPPNEPTVTVDNLEVAQFIYLLLDNSKIRDVIDTTAKKAVLILGRFTSDRKAVLDALKESLRTHGYLPILFDFDKPSSRNFTETVRTLGHLSRFIIADLTDPSSIPQELYAIVPTLAVPVRPVLLEGKKEYAMSIDLLTTYHWMLPIHFYKDQADLVATLKEQVIEPAERKAQELEKR